MNLRKIGAPLTAALVLGACSSKEPAPTDPPAGPDGLSVSDSRSLSVGPNAHAIGSTGSVGLSIAFDRQTGTAGSGAHDMADGTNDQRPSPPVTMDPPVSGPFPPAEPTRVFDAGDDPNRNNVQAGQLCARLAATQCAGETYCCSNPGRDRATCERTLRTTCADDFYVDKVAQHAITGFDQAAATAALTRAEELASQCDPSLLAFMFSPDGFLRAFKGTRAPGESCSPGLNLDLSVATASLVSCTGKATTACLPKSALSWSCEAHSGVGGGCFTDINCQQGLYCPNPELMLGVATCAQRKPVGSACVEGNECQSLFCRAGACVAPETQVAYCPAP